MLLGFILLVIGLLLAYWFSSNLQNPSIMDKPLAFSNPVFIMIGTIVWIFFVVAGIIRIFIFSLNAGAAALSAIVVLAVVNHWLRNNKNLNKEFKKSFGKIDDNLILEAETYFPDFNKIAEIASFLQLNGSNKSSNDQDVIFSSQLDQDQQGLPNLIRLGINYGKRNNYEKAISFLNQAVDLDPSNYLADIGLAICHLKNNNIKEASLVLSLANFGNSGKPIEGPEKEYQFIVNYMLGVLSLKSNDYENALTNFRDALRNGEAKVGKENNLVRAMVEALEGDH